MRLVVHVDGGARGNPGPAAVGVVLHTPEGDLVERVGASIGVATNNVAEYRGVLLGLERALERGASEVELVNDSELVARQLTGEYRVKNAGIKPLHAQARAQLAQFQRWSIRTVPRERNTDADALVNAVLDRGTPADGGG